jgi:hypothetical protein
MAPQSVAVATWTVIRLLPWIISTVYEKILEYDRKKEYHNIAFSDQYLIRLLEKGGVSVTTLGRPFLIKKTSQREVRLLR